MPGPNDLITQQLLQRKIPRNQWKLHDSIQNAPSDLPSQELSPGNLSELMYEIQRQTDPKARAVLQAELDRLREMAGSLQPMPELAAPTPPGIGNIRPMPYEMPNAGPKPGLRM